MLALGLFFIGIILASWAANRLLLQWLLTKEIMVDPIGRSGHTVPTPVGAGLAVMGVVFVGALALQYFGLGLPKVAQLATMATLGLSAMLVWLSWHDDLRDNHGLRVRYRLSLQGLATILPLCLLPSQFDIIPFLQAPIFIERAIVALGWWWFTNLYNFMDGINGITVTETSSICVGVLLLALCGGVALPLGFITWPTLILAATLGFAYFNVRHKALVFIGDTGAIGLGYILGWLLIMLAVHGLFWAAALLVLYYAADTGLTLILRLKRGEKVWQSARCHFYHQGSRPYAWPHLVACGLIALLNIILIAFALIESWQIAPVSVLMGLGLALCGILLYVFYKKGGSQIVVPHLN